MTLSTPAKWPSPPRPIVRDTSAEWSGGLVRSRARTGTAVRMLRDRANRRRVAHVAWLVGAVLAIGKAVSTGDPHMELFYLVIAAVMALLLWASVRWPQLCP